MKKFRGILDVWFDSGIAPWASLGYPIKNKELFESHFPIGRINEAQDQIRGWFYSLMFCSCAVFGKAPYKEVSMTGWVVDKSGNKMSKSVGNVVDAEAAVDMLGADTMRYYFCWDVAPYDVQKFNLDTAKKEMNKIFMILYNLQSLCSNTKKNKLGMEDKWIISKLENMTKNYEELVDKFELNTAFREISEFIVNSLSRDYIQMTREKDNGAIVSECLKRVIQLIAPASPFITEKIWQELRKNGIVKEESVHLTSWPKYDEKKINEKLEKEFVDGLKIIEIGLSERDKEKIGLRWPLGKAEISFPEKLNSEIVEIIARQLNIKKIEMKKGKEIKVKLDLKMTPELEAEGFSRELARKVQAERKNAGLKKEDLINLEIFCDEKLKNMFLMQIDFLKKRTGSKKMQFLKLANSDGKIKFEIKNEKIAFKFN